MSQKLLLECEMRFEKKMSELGREWDGSPLERICHYNHNSCTSYLSQSTEAYYVSILTSDANTLHRKREDAEWGERGKTDKFCWKLIHASTANYYDSDGSGSLRASLQNRSSYLENSQLKTKRSTFKLRYILSWLEHDNWNSNVSKNIFFRVANCHRFKIWLASWYTTLLKWCTEFQLGKKFPPFMEPKILLSSQKPSLCAIWS